MILMNNLKVATQKVMNGDKYLCLMALCYLGAREGYSEQYITNTLNISHRDYTSLYSYASYHLRDSGFVNRLNSILKTCNCFLFGNKRKLISVMNTRRTLFKFSKAEENAMKDVITSSIEFMNK